MFKKNVKGMQQNIKREFWLDLLLITEIKECSVEIIKQGLNFLAKLRAKSLKSCFFLKFDIKRNTNIKK